MIDAIYFDGRSTRRQPVTLVIEKRVIVMRGSGMRSMKKLSQLRISERLQNAPRILYFPGGGCVQVSNAGLDGLLAANGYREPRVVRWQQNWHLSLLALIGLLMLLLSGYQWGLPWVADKTAQHLPASLEKKIGDAQFKLVDEKMMSPSRLDPVDQQRLQRLFAGLTQPHGEKNTYRLEFRHSQIGPNAFALPNGVIVMTDQLVMLARSDQALMAVLAHELGHVQRHHSLRRLLQTLGVGVVVNLFVGDVSNVLTAFPIFLIDQKYSRDFEREADQYAIDMMHANGMSLLPMADLFEKMRTVRAADPAGSTTQESQTGKTEQDDASGASQKKQTDGKRQKMVLSEYFGSHPSDDERIARLRAAESGNGK